MKLSPNTHAGYRYPTETNSHAVWLYFRFTLIIRAVEELLAARGIVLTYGAIQQWRLKFGQQFANENLH